MLDIQRLHQQLCDHRLSRSFRLSILRKLTRQELLYSSLEEALQQVFEERMSPAELAHEFPELTDCAEADWKYSLEGLIRNVCTAVN